MKSARVARSNSKKFLGTPLGELAEVGDGDHAKFPEEDDGTVPYLQARDFGGFVEPVSHAFVTQEYFEQNRRSEITANNVLFSIMGTVGRVGITAPAFTPCIANRAVGIIRPHSGTPASFLFAYLGSRIARALIAGYSSGGVQQRINLDLLRKLKVPTFSDRFVKAIDEAVHTAFRVRSQSMRRLETAESAVVEAVGLAKWTPEMPLSYCRKAKDVFAAERFDAEYYTPAKFSVLARLGAMPHAVISSYYMSMREMFDPSREKGEVRNFDVTDALKPVLDDGMEPVAVGQLGSAKKVLRSGDVAISRLRSYLKEIALVRTSTPAVGSSEFIVLRKLHHTSELSPETLMVFLRSLPVQIVLKYSQDGSNHPRFSDAELLAVPVPNVLLKMQQRVDRLVNESLDARDTSVFLLETTKRAVEVAIEDSEAHGVDFLHNAVASVKLAKV